MKRLLLIPLFLFSAHILALTPAHNQWLDQQKIKLQNSNLPESEVAIIINLLERGLEDPSPFAKGMAVQNAKIFSHKTYEFSTEPLAEYIKQHVALPRVETGLAMMHHHRSLLEKVTARYQVPAEVIVAIWGMETFYGQDTPTNYILQMLAPLAFSGRRKDYFNAELEITYKILAQDNITARIMRGSQTGDMGQPQFQPSSFVQYAVDFNGDGRRDIWHNTADVLASIANYLKQKGWQAGQSWGMPVKIPRGYDIKNSGYENLHPISYWKKLGVTTTDGAPLPDVTFKTALLLYNGVDGPAFLLFPNFRVLMSWNPTYFEALSIGTLSDKIAPNKSAKQ